jgi:hypothetical protein
MKNLVSKLTLLMALALSHSAHASKRKAEGYKQPNKKQTTLSGPHATHPACEPAAQEIEAQEIEANADPKVTLVSSDGKSFEIPKKITMASITLKHMLEDCQDNVNPNIPLQNISGATVKNLIACFDIIHYYKGNHPDHTGNNPAIQKGLVSLCSKLSSQPLANLINAANFLDIPQIIKAIFTSEPLLERTVQLSNNFPPEINSMIFTLQTIFLSKDLLSIEKNIYKTSSSVLSPDWVSAIVNTLRTSKISRTTQDLFLWMAKIGSTQGMQSLSMVGAYVGSPHVKLKALMLAAKNGRSDAVSQLLSSKEVDVNSVDSEGMTALMWAACYGQTSVVEFLLAEGADTDYADLWGKTALMKAATNGHEDIVAILNKHLAAQNC